jgi:hypothetical protein
MFLCTFECACRGEKVAYALHKNHYCCWVWLETLIFKAAANFVKCNKKINTLARYLNDLQYSLARSFACT